MYSETSIRCSYMHCFHASIIHFLWSLYLAAVNNFLQLSFSCIHHLFFVVPSETMDRGFAVLALPCPYASVYTVKPQLINIRLKYDTFQKCFITLF
jgi:hypothetical protein